MLCMCVCLVTQLCLTLCDPVDCSCQTPLSMGILQARILEYAGIPFSRGSSQPRGGTQASHIAGRFFTEPPRSPCETDMHVFFNSKCDSQLIGFMDMYKEG